MCTIREKILDEKIRAAIAVYSSLTALVLLSVGLWQFKGLGLGPFGIIHDFPPVYFLSIFFSLLSGFIAIGVKEEKNFLQIFNYIFLLAALWLIPILWEGTPRFASAYKTIGFVEYIYREGRLEPANWEVFYHNWPGFSIWAAVIWLVTGIEEIYPLVLIYPVFLHLLMLTVLFWLLRQPALKISTPNGWYLGGAIYLLANFINQDYFSPQSMSYYLLGIIITLLINRAQWLINPNRALGYKLIIILLFLTLVISHILSSLVALSLLGVFFFFERKTFYNLVILSLVVLGAWTVYGASVYFNAHITNISKDMFKVEKAWNSNIDNRVKGNPEHILVNKIRIFYAAIFGLCGFIGFLFLIRKKDKKILTDLIKVSSVSVCVAGTFVYGGESFMRAYLLMLLPLALATLGYLEQKKLLAPLCMFCTLAVPFHIIAHYGNEQVDYVSTGIIRGSDFLSRHSTGGYVIGYHQILGNTKYTENFISLTWEQYFEKYLPYRTKEQSYYLGVGPWEKNFWHIFHNDADYIIAIESELRRDKRFVLFYSNGAINLYYVNNKI